MQEILKFLMKKPSDKNMNLIRIIFGVLYISILCYVFFISDTQIKTTFFGYDLSQYTIFIEIIMVLFGIPSIIIGLLDKPFLSSRNTKIMQIIFGIFIIYSCGRIIPVGSGIDATVFLTIMGWFSILAGITGKLITQKGKRQGAKITKVRV